MKILAGCTIEEALKFNGKLTIPNEDKKTPDKVVLNLQIEEGDKVDFKSLPKAVEVITVNGVSSMKVPESYKGKVFNSLSLEAYDSLEEYNSEFPLLVMLPEGYCDMRTLKRECEKNSYVRFWGGNLLGIEGVRIGRYDSGKDKMLPSFCGVYDNFMEAKLGELSGIVETLSKNRKKLETVEKKGKSKSKSKKSNSEGKSSKSKKKEVVSKLFGAGDSAF